MLWIDDHHMGPCPSGTQLPAEVEVFGLLCAQDGRYFFDGAFSGALLSFYKARKGETHPVSCSRGTELCSLQVRIQGV